MTMAADRTREMLEQFERDGYTVARQLFAADEVARIRETFMEVAKDGPVAGLSEDRGAGAHSDNDPLKKYPRMMMPHTRMDLPVGELSTKYMLDARVGAILEKMFGEEPVAVQSMFYFKPPGARGQDLHQDNFYLRVKPGTCIAAWTAIDDADQENGGMLAVPGTNGMDVVCPEKADPSKYFTTEHVEPPAGKKPVAVDLKAGDVMFFNGSVIHGSYPNTSTTRFRRSFICHYVPIGSVELSKWYRTPTRFDGTRVVIGDAEGGGPCGTPNVSAGIH